MGRVTRDIQNCPVHGGGRPEIVIKETLGETRYRMSQKKKKKKKGKEIMYVFAHVLVCIYIYIYICMYIYMHVCGCVYIDTIKSGIGTPCTLSADTAGG